MAKVYAPARVSSPRSDSWSTSSKVPILTPTIPTPKPSSFSNTNATSDIAASFLSSKDIQPAPPVRSHTSTNLAKHNHRASPDNTQTEEIVRLIKAFATLGLPATNQLSNQLIVRIYKERLQNEPLERQSLLDSLRVVAEHKQDSCLDELLVYHTSSAQVQTTAHKRQLNGTLEPRALVDNGTDFRVAAKCQDPDHVKTFGNLANHQTKANDLALKFKDAYRSATVNGGEHMKSVTKKGDPAGIPATAEKPGWMGNKGDPVAPPALMNYLERMDCKPAPTYNLVEEVDCDDEEAFTTAGPVPELRTLENLYAWSGKLFTPKVIQVIAGNGQGSYYKLSASRTLLEALLYHDDFTDLRKCLSTTSPTVIHDVDAPMFMQLLTYMSQGSDVEEQRVRIDRLKSWDHPYLYGLSKKFYQDDLALVFLDAFRRAEDFNQFLHAVKKVYELGHADDHFKSVIKKEIIDAFNDPNYAWETKNWYGQAGAIKAALECVFDQPDFAKDVYQILLDREYARGQEIIDSAARYETQCADSDDNGNDPPPPSPSIGEDDHLPNDNLDGEWDLPPTPSKADWEFDVAEKRVDFVADAFADGKTVFLHGLNPRTQASAVQQFFSQYGAIIKVTIVESYPAGKWGAVAAYIQFAHSDAVATFLKEDREGGGFTIDGYRVYVWLAGVGDYEAIYLDGGAPTVHDTWTATESPSVKPLPFVSPDVVEAQGKTAFATKRSEGFWGGCTLEFRAGERITNVNKLAVPLRGGRLMAGSENDPRTAPTLSGVNAAGQYGTFPASYVSFPSDDKDVDSRVNPKDLGASAGRVYRYISDFPVDHAGGLSVYRIAKSMGMQCSEVLSAASALAGAGLIEPTTKPETWTVVLPIAEGYKPFE